MKSWNEIFPHWGHTIRLPQALAAFLQTGPRDSEEQKYAEWIEEQPKIELHVHMEAAVSEVFYDNLNISQQLYAKNQMPSRRAPFASLKDFIDAWMDNTKLVKDESVYFNLAREFVRLRASQNIVYSEVHVSPVDFSHMRRRFKFAEPLSFKNCLLEILRGLKSAEAEWPQFTVRLIIDALWICTPEEHMQILQDVAFCLNSENAKDCHGKSFIVAIGLGGPEVSSQANRILSFLDSCRALGLRVDIHSGENVSYEDHLNSLAVIKPCRVGHGIAGAPKNYFYDKHISTNPLSNILTGSFANVFSEHPIKKMENAGLNFSVNSDDPLLFGTTLTLEYVALKNAFGWGKDFFRHTQHMAKNAAFTEN